VEDGALDGDAGLPFEEVNASGLGVFSGTVGLHHGGLQCGWCSGWFQPHASGFVPLSMLSFSCKILT